MKRAVIKASRQIHMVAKQKRKRAIATSSKSTTTCSHSPSLPGTVAQRRELCSTLLSWYDSSHRILPWRRNPHSLQPSIGARNGAAVLSTSPPTEEGAEVSASFCLSDQDFAYRVWVSEVMLQQTQVERVKAYFSRWMHRWETLQLASEASLEDVQELWAGLGYYRRARLLLQGLQHVAQEREGIIPGDRGSLLGIPGIGTYTAGAISSIAFGKNEAAVDANIQRVVARVEALKVVAADKRIADEAQALIEETERPGCLNQAFMELGARLCTAKKADCHNCPIGAFCKANELEVGRPMGSQESVLDYPIKATKKERKAEYYRSAVLFCRKPGAEKNEWEVCLSRRQEAGVLEGLWEFHSMPIAAEKFESGEGGSSLDTTAMVRHLEEKYGVPVMAACDRKGNNNNGKGSEILQLKGVHRIGTIKHVFSHLTWHMIAEVFVLEGDIAKIESRETGAGANEDSPETMWVTINDFQPSAYTSHVRKLWKLAMAVNLDQKPVKKADIRNFFPSSNK